MTAPRLGLLGLSLMLLSACQHPAPMVGAPLPMAAVASAQNGASEAAIRRALEANAGVRVATLTLSQVSSGGEERTVFTGAADVMLGNVLDYKASFSGSTRAGTPVSLSPLQVNTDRSSVSKQIWIQLAKVLDDHGRVPDWVRQELREPHGDARVTPVGTGGLFRFSVPGEIVAADSNPFYLLISEYRFEGTFDRKADRMTVARKTLVKTYKRPKGGGSQH